MFPDKCLGFWLELVDEFTKIVPRVYMSICLLGYCISNEINTYVGHTTTTLYRHFDKHLSDSSSIALNLKIQSVSKSNFPRILVENTNIIAHESYGYKS